MDDGTDAKPVSEVMFAALDRIRDRADRGERTWVVRSNPGGTGVRIRTAKALEDRGFVRFVDLGAAVALELTEGGERMVGYLTARRALSSRRTGESRGP